MQLQVSDIIQVIGIIASLITSIIAIIISLVTVRQNSKMIEESTRAVISVYTQSINTGTPMLYLVVRNFGQSPASIQNFHYNFNFENCYRFRSDRDYLKDLVGATIAPGQARICTIDYKKIDRPVTFSIEYTSAGKLYCDYFTVDLTAGVNMPTPKTATKGTELKAIIYLARNASKKSLIFLLNNRKFPYKLFCLI